MSTNGTIKRGLVIGCGGVAGGAWSIATLDAVQRRLAWDPRDARIIVGTSSGAVLAALLGAGIGVDRLMACQHDNPEAGCRWNHDTDAGGALPPLPGFRPTAAPVIRQALRGRVSALTAACALAPRGRFDMAGFRRLIDEAVPAGGWAPHPATWLMTVDTRTGGRVAFGHPDAPPAALNDAVCASYGVPGWCPPVTIDGRDYFDGGVASPASADWLADTDLDEIVVLAPMTSTTPDSPRSPLAGIERRIRRLMTRTLDAEIELLRKQGKRVIRLEPGPEDLRAIGYNMMDPARRRQVFATALDTAPNTLETALARTGPDG